MRRIEIWKRKKTGEEIRDGRGIFYIVGVSVSNIRNNGRGMVRGVYRGEEESRHWRD
jgi:hypothetical protein